MRWSLLLSQYQKITSLNRSYVFSRLFEKHQVIPCASPEKCAQDEPAELKKPKPTNNIDLSGVFELEVSF